MAATAIIGESGDQSPVEHLPADGVAVDGAAGDLSAPHVIFSTGKGSPVIRMFGRRLNGYGFDGF
jgi:hypothetical protein